VKKRLVLIIGFLCMFVMRGTNGMESLDIDYRKELFEGLSKDDVNKVSLALSKGKFSLRTKRNARQTAQKRLNQLMQAFNYVNPDFEPSRFDQLDLSYKKAKAVLDVFE